MGRKMICIWLVLLLLTGCDANRAPDILAEKNSEYYPLEELLAMCSHVLICDLEKAETKEAETQFRFHVQEALKGTQTETIQVCHWLSRDTASSLEYGKSVTYGMEAPAFEKGKTYLLILECVPVSYGKFDCYYTLYADAVIPLEDLEVATIYGQRLPFHSDLSEKITEEVFLAHATAVVSGNYQPIS